MTPEESQSIFQPRSIAIIGASGDQTKFGGRTYWTMRNRRGPEKIYAVNPNVQEINGEKAYPRVQDIEGEVDFAAVAVPARFVVQAVEDCAEKKVRAVEILTAGFKETGAEEGLALGKTADRNRRPKSHENRRPQLFRGVFSGKPLTILPGPDFPKETGSLGLFAQSGGATASLSRKILELGIGINKASATAMPAIWTNSTSWPTFATTIKSKSWPPISKASRLETNS